MSVDDLVARAEIHDVLMRYCRAVDRGDVDLLRSVYHDGATDEHGSFHGLGADFAPRIVEIMDAVPLVGQHHITNISTHVTDETAYVESYFIAFQPYRAASGEALLAVIGGRYLDHFAYSDGRWAISARKVIVDWSREDVSGADWPGAAAFFAGGRRDADPGASFFGDRSPDVVNQI